jgi:HlyD family secretion protein
MQRYRFVSIRSSFVVRSVALLLALAALAFAGWRFYLRPQDNAVVEWQGYVEGDFIKAGPTQAGLITAVHVARGDLVAKGAPLFDQDDANDRAALDQAARQLAQAEEQLVNLQSGGKPTEIEQAEANLADARAARDKTQTDLARNRALIKIGAATVQLVDQEEADLRSANAHAHALEAALEQAQAPMGRAGEIKAQNQIIEAARAALGMARWRLDQRHVASPVAGTIADVIALPGEALAAGAPVVSILAPENTFVRFFVPEQARHDIRPGDEVAILCDGCPPDLSAKISFVAPQAEYTPPVIYSESTRGKLVFLVEARPERSQATLLQPGQPVSVRPKAPGPPR